MISNPPLTVLNEQDEVDRYLKTTGNFVRLAELRDAMRQQNNKNGLCTLKDDSNHAFLAVGVSNSPMAINN